MKTILITGANRGIGLEFTKQYLEQGERVFAACRRPDMASALRELEARHLELTIIELDVQRDVDIEKAVKTIEQSGLSLDMLINNAGMMQEELSLAKLAREELQTTFDVNSVSPIMMVHYCWPLLAKATKPIVLNISSQRGAMGLRQPSNRIDYCTSKAALNMATKIFADDLREIGGIAIAMHPGWVQTDMGGPNGDLTPEISVREMREFLATVSHEHNGGFYRWDGKEHVW